MFVAGTNGFSSGVYRKKMSSIKVHTIQSLAASAALYPVLGDNVVPFGLACVLIDLDHIIEYVRDTRSFAIHGVFPFSRLIETNLDKNFLALSAFHTIEFFSLVYALGLFYPVFMYVLAGMAFHMAADLVHTVRLKRISARAFSVAEYLIRKRNPQVITSIYQLIALKNLNTAGIAGIQGWTARWLESRSRSAADYAN
jgi:hypothetical protein